MIFAILFSWTAAQAGEVQLILDGSGSMRGYVAAKSVETLVGGLHTAADAQGYSTVDRVFTSFADAPTVTWTPYETWKAKPTWGLTTHLSKALTEALSTSPDVVILITDNFQDETQQGGGQLGQTEGFYDSLRQLSTRHVYLFPHLVDFDGHVELSPEVSGACDLAFADALRVETPTSFEHQIFGVSRAKQGTCLAKYRGSRGLAVYAIGTHSGEDPQFTALLQSIGQTLALPTPLSIRGLVQDSIELTPLETVPTAGACAAAPLDPARRPNLTVYRTADGAYAVRPIGEFHYDPRAPAELLIGVGLRATDAHVQVGSASDRCDHAISLSVDALHFTTSPSLANLVSIPDVQAVAAPSAILGTFRNGDHQGMLISVPLPSLLPADTDPAVIAGNVSASAEIVLTVPREAMALRPELAARYFTQNPKDLVHIYSPDDVIRHLSADRAEIRIPVLVQSDVLAPADLAHPAKPPIVTVESTDPLNVGVLAVVTLLAILALGALWLLKPFGFRAYVQVGNGYEVEVDVGGLFRRLPPQDLRLSKPNEAKLIVKVWRQKPWNRLLVFQRDSEPAAAVPHNTQRELWNRLLSWTYSSQL